MAIHCEQVLKNPVLSITIEGFGNTPIELKLMAWVNTQDYASCKHTLQEAINQQLEQERQIS